MHPAVDILRTKSSALAGKKVVLGATGSIGCVKLVEIIHELVRHGAEVYPVMTQAACKIISPDALHYASGHMPVVEITGGVEHVELVGSRAGRADLLIIAPCTANTISKIAHGIDDTPVTTFASTAIGSGIPVMIVPAMHESMYRHPGIEENIERLRRWGVEVVDPLLEEGKAKMASVETIITRVMRRIGAPPRLDGLSGVVVTGPTSEMIDGFRTISNLSTGETGLAIARWTYCSGADVELWSSVGSFPFIKTKSFSTVEDLIALVTGMERVDFAVMVSAVSDFRPVTREGKIPSEHSLTLKLEPTPKVIEMMRDKASFLVAFKAVVGGGVEGAEREGRSLLDTADLVVANDVRDVRRGETTCVLVWPSGSEVYSGTKEGLARKIIGEISSHIGSGE